MQLKSISIALGVALAALAGCDRNVPDATSASGGAAATPGTRGQSSAPAGTTQGATGSTGTSGGTDTKVAQANPRGATSGGAAASAEVAEKDRKFMTEAAGDGLYEVAVGKLAADKASDPAVKKFGQTMVADHTKANDELKQLASTKGVTLPTALPSDKKAELDRLSKASGANFDQQFVRTVGLKDHAADIRKFETAAKESQDPQVKAFAEKTLPTLRQHHSQAQKLAGTAGAR